MRFMVEMSVNLPPAMPADDREALLAREREYLALIHRCGGPVRPVCKEE